MDYGSVGSRGIEFLLFRRCEEAKQCGVVLCGGELVEMSVEMKECEVINIVKLSNLGKGSQKQRQAQGLRVCIESSIRAH